MDNLMIGNVVVVPIIIGVLEVIKKVGLNEKYIPALAIVFGLITGFALNGFDVNKSIESVYSGVAIGLASVGLYSGTKNTFKN